MNHRQHFKSLDGLRGLAVLMVFFYHFYPRTPRDPIAILAGTCWLGVDLFFALSGFLITGILYDTLGDPNFFRNFYGRRSLRLFPVYIVIVACVIAVSTLLGGHLTVWSIPFFIYAANIVVDLHKPIGIVGANLLHLWSLALEEQFYLLWPMAIFLLRNRRRIMWACLIGSAASLVLRWATMADRNLFHFIPYYQLPTRLDGLLVGGALALTLRSPRSTALLRGSLLNAGILCGAVVLALCSLFAHTSSMFSAPMIRFGYLAAAIAFGSAIALSLQAGSWANRLGMLEPLRLFGRYSYGIYLIHLPPEALVLKSVAIVTNHCPTPFLAWLAHVVIILVYLGICLGIAAVSYHLLELPFLRRKDRFAYRDERSAHLLQVDQDTTERVQPISTSVPPAAHVQ
jgi:peptidoglycan/LPS O-acetylase OafA/YrhL